MREVNLDELKQIELDIFIEFDKLCSKLNLRYSMSGGTLLGSVRHQGFIPWDDDIDLFMPRPDYNKLIDYCKNNETPFDLLCIETNPNYGYLFGKIMAKNTSIVEEYGNPTNIPMGIYIDIFPIDGLADTYKDAKKQFGKTRFKRELLVAKNWKRFFRSKTRAWYYEPIRFAFFVMSRFVSRKKLIESIQKAYINNDFDSLEYGAVICGAYREKEIMPKDHFVPYCDMTFENHTFKAIANYDKYLSKIFGNYMQLPPENQRVTHHSFTAYKIDEDENPIDTAKDQ